MKRMQWAGLAMLMLALSTAAMRLGAGNGTAADSTLAGAATGQGTKAVEIMPVAGSDTDQSIVSLDTSDVSSVLHGYGCPMCLLGSASALNLTLKDVQLLESIGMDCQKNEALNEASEKAIRAELKKILDQEQPDWNLAKKKISEFYRLKQSILIDQLECLKSARNALSPEQFAKTKSMDMKDMHLHMIGKSMMDSTAKAK
jgi:Spy/CpxP family protein refolding chaperone